MKTWGKYLAIAILISGASAHAQEAFYDKSQILGRVTTPAATTATTPVASSASLGLQQPSTAPVTPTYSSLGLGTFTNTGQTLGQTSDVYVTSGPINMNAGAYIKAQLEQAQAAIAKVYQDQQSMTTAATLGTSQTYSSDAYNQQTAAATEELDHSYTATSIPDPFPKWFANPAYFQKAAEAVKKASDNPTLGSTTTASATPEADAIKQQLKERAKYIKDTLHNIVKYNSYTAPTTAAATTPDVLGSTN